MGKALNKISLFYRVLLGVILALLLIFAYLRFGMLRPWLTRFEAAQPKHASQEVFADLFSPADWGRVYDLAGNLSMNRGSFVNMMEEMTQGQELTLVETSAGLSGNRRYFVKMGGDNIASFTLASQTEGTVTAWSLDGVELLMELQAGTVSVRALAGQRVLVDGMERGENCQAQFTETAAERYLPEGVHGRRTVLWQIPAGLPQYVDVSVLDENGQAVPVTYDEDAGRFVVEEPAEEPDGEQSGQIIGAAKSYALYMVRAGSSAQLQKYFDSTSQIYKTIRSSELWIQQTSEQTFSNEKISEFRRYGEELFSARVSMHLDIRRSNGTYKPYEVDSTLFFHRVNGKWLAYDMTNIDVQEEILHTRLIFMDGQTEVGRMFVSSEEKSFTPPAVAAPAGQRFVGWATRENEDGGVTMTVRFRPGEDGTAALPAGWVPEPMTLYAAFETA